MATIDNIRLGYEKDSTVEIFKLTVEVTWDPSEVARDPEFILRGWLCEEDGHKDKWTLKKDGEIKRKDVGLRDDIRKNLWGPLTVRPSDGTTFEMGEKRYNVYKVGRPDNLHAIHEYVGEFYAIATIVPDGVSGHIKTSGIQKIRVER